MIGEMYTPPMYRDLMSGGMPAFEFDPSVIGMGSMYGGMGMGMYNTNYLGGISLKPNLSKDSVQIMKSKDKEATKNSLTFCKILLGLFAFGAGMAFLKGKKPWFSKAGDKIGDTFASIKRPVGDKTWYKPWTWLNKAATTP